MDKEKDKEKKKKKEEVPQEGSKREPGWGQGRKSGEGGTRGWGK